MGCQIEQKLCAFYGSLINHKEVVKTTLDNYGSSHQLPPGIIVSIGWKSAMAFPLSGLATVDSSFHAVAQYTNIPLNSSFMKQYLLPPTHPPPPQGVFIPLQVRLYFGYSFPVISLLN